MQLVNDVIFLYFFIDIILLYLYYTYIFILILYFQTSLQSTERFTLM